MKIYNLVGEQYSPPKKISILFVGNSLTQDGISYLPYVLKQLCLEIEFYFYIWHNPGYTLGEHYAVFQNDGTCRTFSVAENTVSWTNTNNSEKMSHILNTYKIDVVCLQEYFNSKTSYTDTDLSDWNNCKDYIVTHYSGGNPLKFISLFHAPRRTDSRDIFELTKHGNATILQKTIAEDMLANGIAVYRALFTSLDELGDQGHLSPDGTHTQEGLPCLLQTFVVACWLFDKFGIEKSIKDCPIRMTSQIVSTLNVPGADTGSGVITGTDAQNLLAQEVAIKAYKEGKQFVNENLNRKIEDNDKRFITYSPIANIQTPSSIALPGFTWAEGVVGSTDTPIVNAKSVLLGSTGQCDFRPLIYEDGSPIIEKNKIYYSMTTQAVAGGGSIICECDIGTAEMRIVGFIRGYLIQNGSRVTCNCNANLVMFNRLSGKWIIATRSAAETTPNRILIIGESYSDPRGGITEVVYSVLDYASPSSIDEDPYIFYSDELDKWVLLYAKIRNDVYTLAIQTSDHPTYGYTAYAEQSASPMHATGLYTTKVGGVRYILTGADQQNGHNRYTAWSFPDAEYVCNIDIDYDDGGYWGWNNLTPVPSGDYTKYIMLTFDRMQTNPLSGFTYGNMYMYCSAERNPGIEFDIENNGVQIEANITPTYGIDDLHMIRQWSKRFAFELEIAFSEIDLDQYVLDDGDLRSNVYPLIGDAVEQNANGVFLTDDGEAMLVAGAHQPLAAYVLNGNGIQPGDYRYIEIFDSSQNVKLKIGIDGNRDVYNLAGSTPTKLGSMNDRSDNIIICTSWRDVYIYNDR